MAARSARRTLFWMVIVALALRLVLAVFLFPQQLDPARDHWNFGYETGRIARSIAEGNGFSSPLFANTGSTAWMTPVYPYIVAGAFKIFGVFTKASALVILSFNALTSALTCLQIFFFARRSFGERPGLWAGWMWAVFPYSIYWPVERIWDTWLATLLLAILFCLALRLAQSNRTREWIGFGALSGLAALTDPVVLSVLPVLALWALWKLHKRRQRWLAPAIAAVLAVVFVISPWFVRNYRTFHRFVPFRDALPLALRAGNAGDPRHTLSVAAGPWANAKEWRDYQELGEAAYMQQTSRTALAYIGMHKWEFVGMSLRRALFLWTSFWNFTPEYLLGFPLEPAGIFLYVALDVLALLGLRRAFQQQEISVAMPYAIVLFFFPVIYYLTSVEPWYRVPMDPIFVALAAYEVVALASSKSRAFLARAKVVTERAS